MIVIAAADLDVMARAAEAAYPRECCGLIVGHRDVRDWWVERVDASANLAPSDRDDRFEVDPAMRLRLQRELRAGPYDIIGHYHSHPDGPAAPSPTDRASIWERDLVWVIISVARGRLAEIAAHRVVEGQNGRGFEAIAIRERATLDRGPRSR